MSYFSSMITGKQIRMARAGLGWSIDRLAVEARVNKNTIVRLERDMVDTRRSSIEAVQYALEAAGVQFVEDGVVLKGPPIVAYLTVKRLPNARRLKTLNPGEPGDIGGDTIVRMADGLDDQIICFGRGQFAWKVDDANWHIWLIDEDDERAKLGLTRAHMSELEKRRPKLWETADWIVPRLKS